MQIVTPSVLCAHKYTKRGHIEVLWLERHKLLCSSRSFLGERFACLHLHKRQSTMAYLTILDLCTVLYFTSCHGSDSYMFLLCDLQMLSCGSRKHFDSPPPGSSPSTASCWLLGKWWLRSVGAHRSDTPSTTESLTPEILSLKIHYHDLMISSSF